MGLLLPSTLYIREIQTPTHQNLISSNTTATPPVIAQQYSSAIFVSLRLHSLKVKFCVRFQNIF
jgi:hypothetical protein